jgi:hypothetical protein
MKRRLNIVFHSQIDDQTKRQNQNLKHFLRMFCFEKQIEWIKFLFLIEFVYQNSVQFIIECNLFFCMYDYNFEIRYESKDDIIMKKMFIVTKRVKESHEYKQKLIEIWQKTTNVQIKYYNRKHIALTFKTKNLIMLFIKNIKLKNLNQNFLHKFIKSFRIIETMNKQTYRLIFFLILSHSWCISCLLFEVVQKTKRRQHHIKVFLFWTAWWRRSQRSKENLAEKNQQENHLLSD